MKRTSIFLAGALQGTACNAPTENLDPEPKSAASELYTNPQKLSADGESQAYVVLIVRNNAGAPVPNVRAQIELIGPDDGVWLVQPGPTDSNGKTTGILISQSPGPLTLVSHLPDHTQSAQLTLETRVSCVPPR